MAHAGPICEDNELPETAIPNTNPLDPLVTTASPRTPGTLRKRGAGRNPPHAGEDRSRERPPDFAIDSLTGRIPTRRFLRQTSRHDNRARGGSETAQVPAL